MTLGSWPELGSTATTHHINFPRKLTPLMSLLLVMLTWRVENTSNVPVVKRALSAYGIATATTHCNIATNRETIGD